MSGGGGGVLGYSPIGEMGGIGFITDKIGLTDIEGQKKLQEEANTLAERSIQLAERSFGVQQAELTRWNEVYGDIQDNLSEFYQNLGPAKIESLGLQAQEKAFSVSRDRISKIFKQRGLSGSGLETEALVSAEVQRARDRATISATAPERAAQLKQSFLNIGLSEKQTLLQTLASAGSGVAGAAGQAANLAGQQAIAQQRANQQMTSDILGLGAAALGSAGGPSKTVK